MPCNSDHMEASQREIAMSRVFQLLDEFEGKPLDRSGWGGYDRRVYCKALSKEGMLYFAYPLLWVALCLFLVVVVVGFWLKGEATITGVFASESASIPTPELIQVFNEAINKKRERTAWLQVSKIQIGLAVHLESINVVNRITLHQERIDPIRGLFVLYSGVIGHVGKRLSFFQQPTSYKNSKDCRWAVPIRQKVGGAYKIGGEQGQQDSGQGGNGAVVRLERINETDMERRDRAWLFWGGLLAICVYFGIAALGKLWGRYDNGKENNESSGNRKPPTM